MNPYTDRTVYETPGTTTVREEGSVERAERKEMFMRYILPLLLCLLTFGLGYALGWNSGRNQLLENTYVDRGAMVNHVNATDGIVGPSPSDRMGR
jgi:hypothetical protein